MASRHNYNNPDGSVIRPAIKYQFNTGLLLIILICISYTVSGQAKKDTLKGLLTVINWFDCVVHNALLTEICINRK